MNNYQDKIDSFRDSLGQQASAFDSASENAKRQIQSAILDKVGKHAEYMSQVGGVIAGGSAGVHGGIKATKKVNEIYNNYKSKARSKISGEQPNEFSTPKNASVDKDISLNEAKATETDAKPITSNVFEDRTTLDQVAGKKLERIRQTRKHQHKHQHKLTNKDRRILISLLIKWTKLIQ